MSEPVSFWWGNEIAVVILLQIFLKTVFWRKQVLEMLVILSFWNHERV